MRKNERMERIIEGQSLGESLAERLKLGRLGNW